MIIIKTDEFIAELGEQFLRISIAATGTELVIDKRIKSKKCGKQVVTELRDALNYFLEHN